jgi:hypothetical protein
MSVLGRYQTDESYSTACDLTALYFAHADGAAKIQRQPMASIESFILPSGLAKVGHSGI